MLGNVLKYKTTETYWIVKFYILFWTKEKRGRDFKGNKWFIYSYVLMLCFVLCKNSALSFQETLLLEALLSGILLHYKSMDVYFDQTKLSNSFLIHDWPAIAGSNWKYFGYNLLKSTDPWGTWKQLGVPGGTDNSSSTKFCTHVLWYSFHWKMDAHLHPYFSRLPLNVAMWLVLTNDMWMTFCMLVLCRYGLYWAYFVLSCPLSTNRMSTSVVTLRVLC